MQLATLIKWLGVIALTAGLSITFGGGGCDQSGPTSAVAVVNGEPIARDTFRAIRLRPENEQRAAQFEGQGLDRRTARQFIDRQVLDSLIQTQILAQEAHRVGLRVTDEELKDAICLPAREAGVPCSAEVGQRLARSSGFASERDFTEAYRRELLVLKLRSLMTSPIRVSAAAAREQLRRAQTNLRLNYVRIQNDVYAPLEDPTDEEIATFIDERDARLREAYDARRAEFQADEEIRARQILFSGENAKQRAQEALEKLEGGADFVVLATEVSDDLATKSLGGDLGFFPRGRMRPEIDQAVFDAELSKLIGPIETDEGFHILRVDERRPAKDLSFEEAAPQLAEEMIQQDKARAKASEVAEAMSAAIAAGESFDAAADAQGLSVLATSTFAGSSRLVPGLAAPGLRDAAVGLTLEDPTPATVFEDAKGFYLISLAERQVPTDAEIDSQIELVQAQMSRALQNKVLQRLYLDRRQAADEAGDLKIFDLEG